MTEGDPVPIKADVVVDSAGRPTWAMSMRACAPVDGW